MHSSNDSQQHPPHPLPIHRWHARADGREARDASIHTSVHTDIHTSFHASVHTSVRTSAHTCITPLFTPTCTPQRSTKRTETLVRPYGRDARGCSSIHTSALTYMHTYAHLCSMEGVYIRDAPPTTTDTAVRPHGRLSRGASHRRAAGDARRGPRD